MAVEPKNEVAAGILICEDEIMIVKDIARTLKGLGYEVALTRIRRDNRTEVREPDATFTAHQRRIRRFRRSPKG